MELLEVPTLADVIRDSGPLGVAETIAIGESLLDALQAAHEAGVLHRDVKPANVLLTRRGAVLTDFGIARRDRDPAMTITGLVLSSPSYLAPERARGEAAGPPADLWGLGATLYTAVEGNGPFERDDLLAALHAVVNEPVPEPERAGVLTPILLRLLSKDPTQRPTVDETRELLSQASRQHPAGTVPMAVPADAATESSATATWTTNTRQPADARPAETVQSPAGASEPSRPLLQPRRRPGRKPVLAGLTMLLAVLAVVAATWLPGLGDPNGEATELSSDSTGPAGSDPQTSPTT